MAIVILLATEFHLGSQRPGSLLTNAPILHDHGVYTTVKTSVPGVNRTIRAIVQGMAINITTNPGTRAHLGVQTYP